MARHHDAPNHGDITNVDWTNVEPVDILAGGIPCQPWSMGGKREGSTDGRDLWPVRDHDLDGGLRRGMIDAIRIIRPPVVILENVPGLLAGDKGAAFRTILEDLAALDYTIRWTTVGACAIGACHHRHRLFVLATLADTDPPDGSLFGVPTVAVRRWPATGHVCDGTLWPLPVEPRGSELPTPTASDTTGAGHAGAGSPNLRTAITLLPTPGARLGDGRGDPGRELAVARMNRGRRNLDDAVALLPTPRASDGAKGGPNQRGSSGDLALPSAVQPDRFGQWTAAVARHELAFGAPAPEPTVVGARGGRRLSPKFVEWMMGLPAGHVTGTPIGRNAQLKALGNGVIPAQAAYALGLLEMSRFGVTTTLAPSLGTLAGAAERPTGRQL
jgi:DNA (cytosine-5)-methyltransferase 1